MVSIVKLNPESSFVQANRLVLCLYSHKCGRHQLPPSLHKHISDGSLRVTSKAAMKYLLLGPVIQRQSEKSNINS